MAPMAKAKKFYGKALNCNLIKLFSLLSFISPSESRNKNEARIYKVIKNGREIKLHPLLMFCSDFYFNLEVSSLDIRSIHYVISDVLTFEKYIM